MRIPFPALILLLLTGSCKRSVIIHPELKDIVETVYASGKVISGNEHNVHAIVNGRVIKKLVKEGDTVKKDQILYIIKNEVPAARLEAAYSNYNNARVNISSSSAVLNDLKLTMLSAAARLHNDSVQYARLANLFKQNIGTRSNVDAAYTSFVIAENQYRSANEKYHAALYDLKVTMRNAESQLVSARSDLDNYFIRSDSDATVFQTYKEAGETIKPNDVMALLGSTTGRVIKLAVDQQDIDKIKPGQVVLLKTDITGNNIYRGVITRLYPVMNELDQTFRVDAAFTVDTQQSFIHSSVEANIIIKEKSKALVIPRLAILTNDSVQVMLNGKKKMTAISTGIRSIDYVEVIQGLDVSSKIVIPAQE